MPDDGDDAEDDECADQDARRLQVAEEQVEDGGDEGEQRELDRVVGAVEGDEARNRAQAAQSQPASGKPAARRPRAIGISPSAV